MGISSPEQLTFSLPKIRSGNFRKIPPKKKERTPFRVLPTIRGGQKLRIRFIARRQPPKSKENSKTEEKRNRENRI